MKSLQFKRLVLVSDTTKSANQFIFQKRFNLITGKNNSIGKSTLVKNLFWALGCDPEFDDNWKSLNCKAMLEFSISERNYIVVRVNNTIIFGRKGQDYRKFYNITGEYSEIISKLVQFTAKLPSRGDTSELETPPPAYYFLPFYIDQIRSWTTPWNSFDRLTQYALWKPTIVKYHTGYLSPEHFEIEETLFEYKDQQRDADEEVKRINTTIDIVEKYVPRNALAISTAEFEEITAEVEHELGNLASKQESLLNKLTEIQSSRYHLNNQLDIAKRSVVEIDNDYKFAVEYIEGDQIECPLCGTSHDNSLISRASILSDQQQAVEQVSLIQNKISILESDMNLAQSDTNDIREQISLINKKYQRTSNNKSTNLTSIVDGFASQSVQRNVEESKVQKQSLSKSISDKQKELKKEQRRLLTKKHKDELGSMFLGFLTEFISKLNAKGVNLNKVKHPTDYKKIFGSGGAAESTRAVLAYQLAIFRQIYFVSNEIPAPLVIDTPNQQEQADLNYQSIVDLIMNDTPEGSQIIMCGMKNQHIQPYANKAKTIELTESKLLERGQHEVLGKELSDIFDSAKKAEENTE